MKRADAIYHQVCLLGKVLAAKNADYGDSVAKAPRLAPGVTAEQALLVRMGDKINRLETLLGTGPRPLPRLADQRRRANRPLVGTYVCAGEDQCVTSL